MLATESNPTLTLAHFHGRVPRIYSFGLLSAHAWRTDWVHIPR
jgi:hypothetical protein